MHSVVGLYRHKRTAATHVLAVMISPDDRRRKPYALPAQCIPYVSLSHRQIRSIVTSVAMAMKERGMNVVGKHLYYIYIDVPSSTAQTLFCLFIMIDS